MGKNEGYLEFIASENFKNQAEVWYKAYNIIREKTELYYDIIISLYDLIESTYLGEDVLFSQIDQQNHFNWCWNKVLTNLEKESIFLKERGQHYDYFWLFFQEAFYMSDGNALRIKDYFHKLFKYDFKKTRSELDMLTEIYKLLESNFKK
jgi:hypothetical protein